MSGLLAKVLLDGSPYQEVGVVPGNVAEGTSCSVNIHCANTLGQEVEVRVWISNTNAPQQQDVVYYKKIIPAYGEFSASCHLCSTGERVFVSGPAGVVVRTETTRPEE